MNKRKEALLASIIKLYIDTAKPVSSSELVANYKIDLSSATIRNEMKVLEEDEYIFQPHTSAGRVPTDKGYRYFVDSLMKDKELTKTEQRNMQAELLSLKAQHNRMAKTMAKMLSHMSNNLVLSGILDSESTWDFGMKELLKKPEFKESEKVAQVVELLECIDENINKIDEQFDEKSIDIYIGSENPLSKAENCSMIISGITFPSGEKGVIAVVGPKRMRYQRNVELIKYVKKLLGSGLIVVTAIPIYECIRIILINN